MTKFSFLFLVFTFSVFAQENKLDRKQIEDYNVFFSQAFIKKNYKDLEKAYSDQSVLMPEHSRQRTGKKNIADFYQQWLSNTAINAFQKTIYELQDFGNYVLEIGTFTENLQFKDQKAFDYNGKYMVLWKRSSKKKQPLTISAEIWGSNTYFDDKLFPEINDDDIPPTKEYKDSDPLTTAIKERNSTIKKLVQQRDGAEHAKLFMPDAIYLTYYTPMIVGRNGITEYFTEHEKPGTFKIDEISIQTSGIIDAKSAVIEFGFYNVDWSDGNSKGNVKGKSINIWKRNSDGQFLLFRQMVNHD